MSATIDHLEAHHRVIVIQGFVDARGVDVPAGASGVIRMVDIDFPAEEVTIDWEREGGSQRLTFSLNATDGPRNGRMRDYFEKGELVLPPRKPKPGPPSPPPEPERAIARPDEDLGRFEGKQPREEVLLKEIAVACSCDPAFHRQVYPAGRLGVHACLHCGTVTVTRTVGDDGRFTGDAWTAYWTVPTPQHVVDWLGRFPRVSIDYSGAPWRWPMSASLVRYPTLLYPSDVRVADLDELAALETALNNVQAPLSRANRLYSACGDIPPAPGDLPDAFFGFGSVQHALMLRPDSDLSTLKALADVVSPSSELAAAILIRRKDAYDVMMSALRSSDDYEFGAGIAMLRDARPLFSGPDDPGLAPALLKLMNALPAGKLKDVPGRVESWSRFESLLVAIGDLRANSQEMLDGLARLGLELANKDATVVEAIRIVINELNGVDNRPPEYR